MKFELHPDLVRDGFVLGEFPLSLLLMINDAAYPWFVLVPQRAGIKDAYELHETEHRQLMYESRAVCTWLMSAFGGDKMNVAALGNMTPQLHIHHIVRRKGDPAWPAAVWGHAPLSAMNTQYVADRLTKLRQSPPAEFRFTV